ncbi:MAG: glycosyltransferase family 39 protein [Candidatus Methanoperedens sp.]|nr:glycosyltransferase family 39 protein [Candidatus Methanoperedens sp.]
MKRANLILLSIVSLAVVIYNTWWIYSNNLPPTWDDAWHLMSSMRYYFILTHPGLNMFEQMIQVDWYYPPFVKFSTAFVYMVLGVSVQSAIFTNIIYFLILFFSTYYIGCRLFNQETGVLAALLISLYPATQSMIKWYNLDFGMTALVALCIALLLKSNCFENTKYSLLFGIFAGFALLAKWYAAIYLAIPILWSFYESQKEKVATTSEDRTKIEKT